MNGQLGSYKEFDCGADIVESITEAIASSSNEEVTDLPTLYETVDPDYLQDLIQSGGGDVRVTFQYAEHNVVVNGNGQIAVSEVTNGSNYLFGACAHCEEELEIGVDYPVTTKQTDGDVSYFAFCDADCKASWETND